VVFANLYAVTLALFAGTAFIVEAGVFVVISVIIIYVTLGQQRCQHPDKTGPQLYTSP